MSRPLRKKPQRAQSQANVPAEQAIEGTDFGVLNGQSPQSDQGSSTRALSSTAEPQPCEATTLEAMANEFDQTWQDLTAWPIAFDGGDTQSMPMDPVYNTTHSVDVTNIPQESMTVPDENNQAQHSWPFYLLDETATIAAPTTPLLTNSVDDKERVHSVYFGLSGAMDPHVLEHCRYNSSGEFPMFKLIYRNVYDKSTETPDVPSPLHLARQTQGSGTQIGSSFQAHVPVHFMVASDELAKNAKKETAARPEIPPEILREELDRLVSPEDGQRLIIL